MIINRDTICEEKPESTESISTESPGISTTHLESVDLGSCWPFIAAGQSLRCSLMFAPNVIGTANATAAGWGNTGERFTKTVDLCCGFPI